MEDRISVIVPVYDVEAYLADCVNSIIKQTYTNMEIILVDDGSNDNSPVLCDEFAKQDSRIIVIHKEHEGLSVARNAGIAISSGEYLCFIDSDDYILPEYIMILYHNLVTNQADISICGYYKQDENSKTEPPVYENKPVIINADAALCMMDNRDSYEYVQIVVAICKLYKKSLFQKMRYPEGKIHEDEYVIHHLLYGADRIVICSACLYCYRLRSSSITNNNLVMNPKHFDLIEAYRDRLDFLLSMGKRKLAEMTWRNLLLHLAIIYRNSLLSHTKEAQDINRKSINEYRLAYGKYHKVISYCKRLKYRLFIVWPSFFIHHFL